jgi:hypothetical protein
MNDDQCFAHNTADLETMSADDTITAATGAPNAQRLAV